MGGFGDGWVPEGADFTPAAGEMKAWGLKRPGTEPGSRTAIGRVIAGQDAHQMGLAAPAGYWQGAAVILLGGVDECILVALCPMDERLLRGPIGLLSLEVLYGMERRARSRWIRWLGSGTDRWRVGSCTRSRAFWRSSGCVWSPRIQGGGAKRRGWPCSGVLGSQ